MGRVVIITGVAGEFAAHAARALAEHPDVDRVVGIDTRPPTRDLRGVKFVRADIRTPVVGKIIAVEGVDAIVHLDVHPSEQFRGRSGAKELNVIGTMQVVAAAQRSPDITKFVLGSSTAVYGTSPKDPALFTEADNARGGTSTGFPKDSVEVESYVRGFSRRRPEVIVTMLRMAHVLNAGIPSPFLSYLSNPLLPSAIGFDPRLQFLHLDDAVNVVVDAPSP